MPQMSPMSWTLIILTLIMFLSVTNSNMPKMNKTMDFKKKVNLAKKTMKW